MYSPDISVADAASAKYYKIHATNPLIRNRMNVIYLRSLGFSPGACSLAAGVCANSITRWTRMYIEGGLSKLLHIAYYRPKSDLHGYVDTVRKSFAADPPQSIGQARKRIFEITGLKRGITQVRHFIKSVLGFHYRKFRPLPGGKKSMAELIDLQANFVRDTLNPLLKRAKKGAIDVFFVDASHPVQGFHGGYAWSEQPRYVRTGSGRQRVNILGALHAVTRGLFSITTQDYISAPTVVELIAFLREEHPGRQIHLVLDNARYQKCELVRRVAKRYHVNLVFLPPYSPNLNLIERYWKFLKSEVLAGVYHDTKQAFNNAINRFIDDANAGVFDEQLESLLTLDFQILKNDN